MYQRYLGLVMQHSTQRLHYPIIKEYSLNLIRVPIIFKGIFLN